MPRLTSKFRPIHHQQLSFKPRYSAQRFQVLRSHRKNLRRWPIEGAPAKEDVPDNLLVRYPRFRVRRYSNSSRAQSSLRPIGFEVEHQRTWSCRRSIRLFPNVDICPAQTLWTQTGRLRLLCDRKHFGKARLKSTKGRCHRCRAGHSRLEG